MKKVKDPFLTWFEVQRLREIYLDMSLVDLTTYLGKTRHYISSELFSLDDQIGYDAVKMLQYWGVEFYFENQTLHTIIIDLYVDKDKPCKFPKPLASFNKSVAYTINISDWRTFAVSHGLEYLRMVQKWYTIGEMDAVWIPTKNTHLIFDLNI